ncbi:MAG: cytochrome c-type biogenesis protein CcmH [Alphaproteobacteria bacterium]
MFAILITLLFLFVAHPVHAADAPDLEEQTRAIASELRCVVCQNLSVADSPSDMAKEMRAIVREQVAAGKSPQQIKDYFVSKYGEWVLLAPTTKGFSLLAWVVPFVVLIAGLALGLVFLRGWTKRKKPYDAKMVDAGLLARVRKEAAADDDFALDLEDSSERASVLQERARLYADLKELDFDYQAGKLSETDYTALRSEIETKAATVLEQLDRTSKSVPHKKPAEKPPAQPQPQPQTAGDKDRAGVRGWQLAVGGAFLLVFGVTVGVLLTNSLRSRDAGQGSITGDFLTGTGSPGGDSNEVASVLQEGKAAFSKQDWQKAIESFKKVLAVDPNQPEAHAYMGAILLQAGHADGALMAFDKALSLNPNFPMALWGKGMALYQGKKDFAGARQVFEKLLQMLPPGQDRAEIEKIMAEIPQSGQKPQQVAEATPAPTPTNAADQISGKITIDPKLKDKVDGQAVLFIIARSGDAGGAPTAVKKIDRPVFPLAYSIGSENSMMQGVPLSGKLNIIVRLDKDGNPMTHQSGDLTGDYKKNPVAVGAHNVDIVIDQLAK